MSENGEIYTTGKNFTLPPALTAWTNSTSAHHGLKLLLWHSVLHFKQAVKKILEKINQIEESSSLWQPIQVIAMKLEHAPLQSQIDLFCSVNSN